MTSAGAVGAGPPAAVLELADRTADLGRGPLGLWRDQAAAVTDPAAAGPGTLWRVRLPAGRRAGEARLAAAEVGLAGSRSSLAMAEARLHGFVAMQAERSFGPAGTAAAAGQPESELRRLLTELPAASAGSAGDVDFALSGPSGLWRQATAEAGAFLAQLDAATAARGRVETEQAGRVIATTVLGWPGNLRTVRLSTSGADQLALHQRAVDLVLESRLALVRTAVTVLRASALVLTLLTPGGALLAFPAALRFVSRILAPGATR